MIWNHTSSRISVARDPCSRHLDKRWMDLWSDTSAAQVAMMTLMSTQVEMVRCVCLADLEESCMRCGLMRWDAKGWIIEFDRVSSGPGRGYRM